MLKDKRAEYGEQVVKKLAQSLVERFGKGFQVANLYHFIAFYNYHPDIFYAVSRKSENILNSLRSKSSIRRMMQFAQMFPDIQIVSPLVSKLSWSHFLIVMPLKDKLQREFYLTMAASERWSKRTLQAKIDVWRNKSK